MLAFRRFKRPLSVLVSAALAFAQVPAIFAGGSPGLVVTYAEVQTDGSLTWQKVTGLLQVPSGQPPLGISLSSASPSSSVIICVDPGCAKTSCNPNTRVFALRAADPKNPTLAEIKAALTTWANQELTGPSCCNGCTLAPIPDCTATPSELIGPQGQSGILGNISSQQQTITNDASTILSCIMGNDIAPYLQSATFDATTEPVCAADPTACTLGNPGCFNAAGTQVSGTQPSCTSGTKGATYSCPTTVSTAQQATTASGAPRCSDGMRASCTKGVLTCADQSTPICPATKTTITGTTPTCTDGSTPTACTAAPKSFTCDDGSTPTCSSGVVACVNGNSVCQSATYTSSPACSAHGPVCLADPICMTSGSATGAALKCSEGNLTCSDGSTPTCPAASNPGCYNGAPTCFTQPNTTGGGVLSCTAPTTSGGTTTPGTLSSADLDTTNCTTGSAVCGGTDGISPACVLAPVASCTLPSTSKATPGTASCFTQDGKDFTFQCTVAPSFERLCSYYLNMRDNASETPAQWADSTNIHAHCKGATLTAYPNVTYQDALAIVTGDPSITLNCSSTITTLASDLTTMAQYVSQIGTIIENYQFSNSILTNTSYQNAVLGSQTATSNVMAVCATKHAGVLPTVFPTFNLLPSTTALNNVSFENNDEIAAIQSAIQKYGKNNSAAKVPAIIYGSTANPPSVGNQPVTVYYQLPVNGTSTTPIDPNCAAYFGSMVNQDVNAFCTAYSNPGITASNLPSLVQQWQQNYSSYQQAQQTAANSAQQWFGTVSGAFFIFGMIFQFIWGHVQQSKQAAAAREANITKTQAKFGCTREEAEAIQNGDYKKLNLTQDQLADLIERGGSIRQFRTQIIEEAGRDITYMNEYNGNGDNFSDDTLKKFGFDLGPERDAVRNGRAVKVREVLRKGGAFLGDGGAPTELVVEDNGVKVNQLITPEGNVVKLGYGTTQYKYNGKAIGSVGRQLTATELGNKGITVGESHLITVDGQPLRVNVLRDTLTGRPVTDSAGRAIYKGPGGFITEETLGEYGTQRVESKFISTDEFTKALYGGAKLQINAADIRTSYASVSTPSGAPLKDGGPQPRSFLDPLGSGINLSPEFESMIKEMQVRLPGISLGCGDPITIGNKADLFRVFSGPNETRFFEDSEGRFYEQLDDMSVRETSVDDIRF